MDPLLDEKFLLTVSQLFPEFIEKNLGIQSIREAYGPSKNEGMCYENATRVKFHGDVNGSLSLCLDGYTKLKLLPRIANSYKIDPTIKSNSSSIMLEFANQICARLVNEMKQGRFELRIDPPENLNNKLVPISKDIYRQYILIFFLKDKREQSYLGRIYLILLMEKYKEA